MKDEDQNYSNLTVSQLKIELVKYSLPITGRKQDLVSRLTNHLKLIETKVSKNKEHDLTSKNEHGKTKPTNTANDHSSSAYNTSTESNTFSNTKKPCNAPVTEGVVDLNTDYSSVSEEERRRLRLQRFGLQSTVSGSEQNKLVARALRFGLGSPAGGISEKEEEKLLKRRQRFGTITK